MNKSNFVFKKHLGQNFLIDNNIVDKIISSCFNLEHINVVEIGPGKGTLTKALLKNSLSVTAIEKDTTLIPFLEKIKQEHKNFNYFINDATKINIASLVPTNCAIVANLPYNIGTFLFTSWLPYAHHFQYWVLMFQKEVALRITANPNQPHYGRLSLFTQLYGKATTLFPVKNTSFKPIPQVDSAVIKFIPHTHFLKVDIKKFTTLTHSAFSKRRKTIKVSLKSFNINFEKLGINPQSRPQELTFNQFVLLSENI